MKQQQPPSPSAESFHPLAPVPGQVQRMTRGRWPHEPEPLLSSLLWRNSPTRPIRWHTRWRCQTPAGIDGGKVARGADTASGPGGGPQPVRPGTACRGCGRAAPHRQHGAARKKETPMMEVRSNQSPPGQCLC